jgi:glycosyltransferase involved in cell wall biosynthesis
LLKDQRGFSVGSQLGPQGIQSMLQVSVLLATFRRSDLLSQTLGAMAQMSTAGIAWELLVVDNGGDDATRRVCESFTGRLPLRYLVWTRPGQNAARNHGLKEVSGELVLLSDDDMLPEEGWLREMHQGAERWPEQVLFGGRILPNWPGPAPEVAFEPDVGRWTFGICDPQLPEGPDPLFLPISMNMAIRRRVFESGMAFDERIGPNGRNYAMGSETEFNLRLRRQGYPAVFLPKSVVRCVIQRYQMDPEWLVGRAFRQGRGETRIQAPISWPEMARLTKHAIWATQAYYRERLRQGPTAAFRKRLSFALTRGRLYEAWRLKFGFR